MEKVKTLENNNRFLSVLTSKKAKYIMGTILLSGIRNYTS